MFSNWKEIVEQQKVNLQDKYRCKFFGQVISHTAGYLQFKLEALKEFGEYIDSAYNLKGICVNSTFVNPKSELGPGRRKSPLSDKLLLKMNSAW